VDLYVGCVAGASLRDEYLEHVRRAGFTNVEIVHETRYDVPDPSNAEESVKEAMASVRSVKVRATKPAG
jgi:hypothetical protein